MKDTEKIHKFKLAGLGKAPFRIIKVEEKKGPIKSVENGVTLTVGAPGQPMGFCHFCGTGIAVCFTIESADGKKSIVGSTCVEKTGDRGLKRQAAPHLTKIRRAKEAKRIEAAKELLKREDVRKQLTLTASPNKYSASMLGHVEWMLANAGNAGMIRVARVIEKAEKLLNEK